MIMCDYFKVRPGNKDIVIIRTESGRFFKISNRATRRIKTDGHIDENNGLVRKAVQVCPSYVAELYARFGASVGAGAGDGVGAGAIYPKTKMIGKASDIRIRKFEGFCLNWKPAAVICGGI